MSYVELKHLLADLALEAVRNPDRAAWAAVAAAYGVLARPPETAISWDALRATAERMGARFAWRPRPNDAGLLVARGLFDVGEGTVALRPQFVPFLAYLTRQTSRLLDALWTVARSMDAGAVDDLRRGVALFNAGLFFECHELLEDVWKTTEGADKAFFQGIVQIAAAFYHYEKRNRHGARTLLGKGMQKLAGYSDQHLGVDLAGLIRLLDPWAAFFSAGGPGSPPAGSPPRISMTGDPQNRPPALC